MIDHRPPSEEARRELVCVVGRVEHELSDFI
jgi:hypothetical protein